MEVPKPSPLTASQRLGVILNESPVSYEVGNFCKYVCHTCGSVFHIFNSLKKHCRKSGHGKFSGCAKYLSLTKAVAHECCECKMKILCEREIIHGHVKRAHKMELDDYVSKHGLPVGGPEKDLDFDEFLREIPIFDAQERPMVDKNAIPWEKTTRKIGNMCLYECQTCKKPFRCWNSLVAHNKSKHFIHWNAYEPGLVKEARYHRCLLCSKNILCDMNFITRHAAQRHKLKIAEYEERAKKLRGEEVKVKIATRKKRQRHLRDEEQRGSHAVQLPNKELLSENDFDFL